MTEYEEAPHPTLRQGDIILAPTAVLRTLDEVEDLGEAISPMPDELGRTTHSLIWVPPEDREELAVVVESVVTPVLVLSHDCQLEKDFNERVRELMAGGMDVEEAQGIASSDPTLDPLAVVAALQPYEAFPAHRHAGIRSGDRIGYFPVNNLPQDGGDYAVDLGRLTTISVQLLPQAGKIASLASTSVAELRYKLAEAYSIRDLSVLLELEGMVGQTIQRVEALPRNKKKTSLVLHLANGEIVHLEIRKPREELPEEITRLPQTE